MFWPWAALVGLIAHILSAVGNNGCLHVLLPNPQKNPSNSILSTPNPATLASVPPTFTLDPYIFAWVQFHTFALVPHPLAWVPFRTHSLRFCTCLLGFHSAPIHLGSMSICSGSTPIRSGSAHTCFTSAHIRSSSADIRSGSLPSRCLISMTMLPLWLSATMTKPNSKATKRGSGLFLELVKIGLLLKKRASLCWCDCQKQKPWRLYFPGSCIVR